jgi:threonine dehydrogenase-like Zn-dependent dehydrogenase
MPRSGRKAVLVAPKEPLEIWTCDVPAPASQEVLVRVTMGGVCGTDVHMWRGDAQLSYPVVLGHEGIGIIEELGDGVTHDHASQAVNVGDTVYWCPISACHRCFYCTVEKDFSSCENKARFGPVDDTTWASYSEYALLPAGMSFYRASPGTPPEAIIALGCAMPAVLQGLDRLGDIGRTQTVVVQGAGPIGLAAVMLARLAGARRIIVIEAQPQRLEMAGRFGATDLVSMGEDVSVSARVKRIRDLLDGRGADVVIEASGVLAAFEEGLKLVARNGRYLLVGLWAGEGTIAVSPFEIVKTNISIVGTSFAQPEHYYRAMKLVERHHNEIPLADCVTHRFNIEASQAALNAVRNGETVKAVITPSLEAVEPSQAPELKMGQR